MQSIQAVLSQPMLWKHYFPSQGALRGMRTACGLFVYISFGNDTIISNELLKNKL